MPNPRKDADGLNAQQRRFVAEYLIDLNATQAASRAGYSARTAQHLGYQLLQKPPVAAAIAAGKAAQLAHADLTAARVLEEMRRLAFSDVGECFDPQGRLKPLREMSREARAAIASVKSTRKNLTAGDGVQEDVVELKLWDKPKVLSDLARHFALLTDVVQVSGDVTLTEKIARARERGAQLLAERQKRGGGN